MPPIRTYTQRKSPAPAAFMDSQPSTASMPSTASTPTPTGKPTNLSSWIWDHGTKYICSDGNKRWRCNFPHCTQTYAHNSSGKPTEHLAKVHRIFKDGAVVPPTNQHTIEGSKPPINPKVLRKLIVEWIIDRRHAFNEIEAKSFRKILAYIDVAAVSKLPKKGDTVRADTVKYFSEAKAIVKELLTTARSLIHLSFDLWTSPNYRAMIAITAHWTSSNYTVETILLAIREVLGGHTGENISNTVYQVAQEYNIVESLGYFMMDGATNNDTCIQHLDERIQEDGGVGFNAQERRLRCFAHIMNRVVRKLLFGGKAEVLEADPSTENEELDKESLQSADKRREERESSTQWRALGAIGKLHNVVKWIRCTPQRRTNFLNQPILYDLVGDLQKQEAFMLRADNDTRWNSSWGMVDSALKQQHRVDTFCSLEPGLENDKLTLEDWADLRQLMELLAPFKWLTMLGEERGSLYGSIATTLWGMDMLLEMLETARTKSKPNNLQFQGSLDLAWTLLQGYYGKTDDSPVHVASLVLDPRLKFSYCDRHWEREWTNMAKERIAAFYGRYTWMYSCGISNVSDVEDGVERETEPEPEPEPDMRLFDVNKWRFGNMKKKDDELTRYLRAPLLVLEGTANDNFDVMEWWRGNAKEYPILARMAFDVFSIPAMSVEPERVFSGYVPAK